MADEEAKAVQEASKAVVKVTEAAQELGGFISKVILGPLEQGIGIFEDKLKYIRFERQLRLKRRVDELLFENGLSLPGKPVPLKIAIPLFQAASMEEDDYLQDKWATLLINATNESIEQEVKRAHITILENLSALDAQNLEMIYSDESMMKEGIYTENLPQKIEKGLFANIMEVHTKELSKEIILSLSNLARLGCIETTAAIGGGRNFDVVLRTQLGRDFVEMCRLPRQPQTVG
ncbi:DUF4393 domain-containing protein [Dickeya zeae]|uniref:Abi-alpha family protein n=1 Tax=Dickeya zeae TaxID=204042 RepID=UPI001CFB14E0|nr:Abi-alpha family protein [Dickeya zeae]UCZ75339.1 DUF4393 domain-containing protein [Dickeya zeae]